MNIVRCPECNNVFIAEEYKEHNCIIWAKKYDGTWVIWPTPVPDTRFGHHDNETV